MDNYFEQIQDYLDGTLSPEDRRRFEEELARNADLRMETDHQRMLGETLRKRLGAEHQVSALRATLKDVSDQHFSRPAKKGRPGLVRWLIPLAAAACLLVVSNWLGWFATDYEALPTMPVSATRGVDQDDHYRQAAEAYNGADYSLSADLLSDLVSQDTGVVRYRYYLGLSYLGNNDYEQALDVLGPVADGPSVFADDACYFLAVASWRLGKVDEAIRHAEKVSPTSDYGKKAEKLAELLLKNLKKRR